MTDMERVRRFVHPADLLIESLERSETIPSAWYIDPAFHDFDLEAIFSRTWQHIGHQGRLREAGDQTIASAAGNPVISVRDKDGTIRSFYNVCRHRGGPLALEDCSAKVLQCKYHGWTYLLDGSLRGTPKFDRTELFDKKDFGLVPIRAEVWDGLMFAAVTEPLMPLPELVRGISERIAPERISGKIFYKRVVYEVKANWKVYVDNYLEGYHLPFVHPDLTNLLDYQNYVTETADYHSLQYSGIAKADSQYGSGIALYYFLFPNFMLNILPGGRLQTNLVLPLAHDRCRVVFDYYYDDVTSPEALRRIADDIAYSDHVQQEDAEICEAVQRGLSSRAYDKGRFSVDMENGVYHFQTLLKKAYGVALQQR